MHPISEILCEAYKSLLDNNEVVFPLLEEHVNKIDSAVKTVNATYFGFSRYPSNKEKAAAYFYYIIKDHPVADGNKRLAVLFLELYTTTFRLKINLPKDVTLDMLAVAVESAKINHLELIPIVSQILFIDNSHK